MSDVVFATNTVGWDETFAKSTRVDHQKVSFYTRLGINLVGDLYTPTNREGSVRSPAIVVGRPCGVLTSFFATHLRDAPTPSPLAQTDRLKGRDRP